MKLKKGDQIKVVAGKDKGKTGKIEAVNSKTRQVLVAGVNEYKRHQKGGMGNTKSEILTITKPINEANVQLICPKCGKLTRIGYKIEKNEKMRICRKCKKEI